MRSMPAWSIPRDATIHLPDGDRIVMAVVPNKDERVSVYLRGQLERSDLPTDERWPRRITMHRLSPVMVTENIVARAMADLMVADYEEGDLVEYRGETLQAGKGARAA